MALSKVQSEISSKRSGDYVVIAGAGSGKTTVMADRIVNMILEGVDPAAICMLTFTETGAKEIKERIIRNAKNKGYKKDLSGLYSSTFHGFGFRLITEYYKDCGFTAAPTVIKPVRRAGIVADLIRATVVPGLDYMNFDCTMPGCKGARAVAEKAFEVAKVENVKTGHDLFTAMPNAYCAFMNSQSADTLFQLYDVFCNLLKRNNYVEYADMGNLIFTIQKAHPDCFEKLGFQHIIVDEFQDTNELQFRILQALRKTSVFKSCMVVGDDSQSIFAFQGADVDLIRNFTNRVPGAKDFTMDNNYRSLSPILDFANTIDRKGAHRTAKNLTSMRGAGDPVQVAVFWKKDLNYQYALETIQKEHAAGTAYEDIAYIAYTRNEVLKMGSVLTEAGIPCTMINPEPLLENSRVIGALALAKFLDDEEDTKDALVYLNAKARGQLLQTKTVDELKAEIDDLNGQVEVMLNAPEDLQKSLFISMLQAIDEDDEIYQSFVESVNEEQTFDDMLSYCRLFGLYGQTQATKRVKKYPGVVLTTAHSSKGKEWKVVINDLSKYHTKEVGDNYRSRICEERRRLLFVSATRARDRLYITGQAVAYGTKKDNTRVLNKFLVESCEAAHVPFPVEPTKANK